MSVGGPPVVAPAGLLIGRGREAEYIGSFVDRAASEGGALLLEGEAGVGKTALLEVAAARAAASGIRLLPAAGAEFEADVMFAALHQLLNPLFDSLSELDPPHRNALTVALGLGEGSVSSQLLIANAALTLLRRAAAAGPVLVIVDDVPWLRPFQRRHPRVRGTPRRWQPRGAARRPRGQTKGASSRAVDLRAMSRGRWTKEQRQRCFRSGSLRWLRGFGSAC